MVEEKKEIANEIKYDKYTKWLGIIENILDAEINLNDSNINIYNPSLLRKCNLNNESLHFSYYMKSPSEIDGFSEAEEKKIKFFLLLMMQEAGIILKVNQTTILTAQNILNRFFWRVSLNNYEPFLITITCFYIACKVEEIYRRLRDVISAFSKLYSKKLNLEKLESFVNLNKGSSKNYKDNTNSLNDKSSSIKKNGTKNAEINKNRYENILDICSDTYKILKNNVCFYEIEVFKELGFSVYTFCDHPHKYLTHFIKHLKGTKELLQKSWNYLNDAYKTDIPVHYPPYVIACSAIFLAARIYKLPLPRIKWWEIYETRIDEIQEICSELMNLNENYSNNEIKISEIREILYNKSLHKSSFDQQEKIKSDLERLKKQKKDDKNKKQKEKIKYESSSKRKSRYSRSRSRSYERRHRSRSRGSSYSKSIDSKSRDYSNDEGSRNYSDSSSSVDLNKIKEKLNRRDRDKESKKHYSRRSHYRDKQHRKSGKKYHRKYSSSSFSSRDRDSDKRREKRRNKRQKERKKERSESSSESRSSSNPSSSSQSSNSGNS